MVVASFWSRVHRHTARGDPRHQGGKGWRGRRELARSYRQRHVSLYRRQNHNHHNHHNHHTRFKHTRFPRVRRSLRFVLVTFYCTFMWMMRGPQNSVAHAAGAAKRRRERRLGQFLRHERLTVAMLLAECQHHAAPRGQSRARSGGGNEATRFLLGMALLRKEEEEEKEKARERKEKQEKEVALLEMAPRLHLWNLPRCPSQSLWQEAPSMLLQLSCPRASASADCTDSATAMCSAGAYVAMSCDGGSFTPGGAVHGVTG